MLRIGDDQSGASSAPSGTPSSPDSPSSPITRRWRQHARWFWQNLSFLAVMSWFWFGVAAFARVEFTDAPVAPVGPVGAPAAISRPATPIVAAHDGTTHVVAPRGHRAVKAAPLAVAPVRLDRLRDRLRPVPAATDTSIIACLPPIPSALPTPMGLVAIQWVPNLMADDSIPAYGTFQPVARVISLRAGMNRVTAWVTLAHEEFHEMQFESDVRLPEAVADHLADVVAARRVWQMQRAMRAQLRAAGQPGGAGCPDA